MRLGIIADTHGLLRAEVFDRFAGVEHILHAGDIGDEAILEELGAVAPVTAVWGNTDGWEIRGRVPEIARVELGGARIVVIHGQQWGSPNPARAAEGFPDADLVVFGHSHRAEIERVDAVLAVNPGSAGPVRFGVAPSVALATAESGVVDAKIVWLQRPER